MYIKIMQQQKKSQQQKNFMKASAKHKNMYIGAYKCHGTRKIKAATSASKTIKDSQKWQ